jgi:hypothetical protein
MMKPKLGKGDRSFPKGFPWQTEHYNQNHRQLLFMDLAMHIKTVNEAQLLSP